MENFSMPSGMRLASIWVVWGVIAIGALGWALFAVLDAFGLKQEAAAWLQAFGGIAAVCAAFYIGNKQTKDAIAVRDAKQHVVVQLVLCVTSRAAAVSSLLFQSFTEMQSENIALKTEIMTSVEEQLMALKGINPVDFPSQEMVEPFLVIRGALEQSIVFARLLAEGDAKDVMRCAYVFSTNSQAINIAAQKLAELQQPKKK
ncbi:hypothetical protein GWQ44_09710 [Pseudomonas sp. 3MA1]|uniref:hypothetical protein n=1 Tax=Pseudomonas sp. 3MA1 TaxID=2699196 RepID=UPI0023DD6BC1|nr:hypothetical protein [Pseudomonas sp. 3MA1]MDF2395811.1 hypothetical protein [Pseudomonas sp. 3MA1]